MILAVVLALGPPLAFLMIPAAGFFLPLLPFWSVGVVGLLFVGFLILGRIPHAIGVAVLAIAGALSPLGTLTLWSVNAVSDVIKLQNAASELIAKCATGVVPLKPPSAKYDLIVLDDVDTTGEQNYEAVDTIAVLAGMRVVAIRRGGLDRQFYEASETTASACVEGRDTAKVGVTPRGTQRKMAPLAVDVCLRRTKIADPSRDQAPAIVLRNIAGSGADYCRFTQVVERTASGELELGRAIPPNPVMPKAVAQGSWLLAVLSEVLQQDLSDKALMAHAVKTTK
ncbi:hypothetical protein [Bradyrhizobium ivorense]|uniref:hypothetical protein n=1 Tax=Bradyrhizobium ivorense TaxID=2511166 RepID=UPI001115C2A5|nr:hypothetical protein [Bradyrhizobium ivorense]